MSRKPSFQFYPADWLSDGAVQASNLNTQGAWANLLCYMWNAPQQGKLTGSEDEIRRLSGAKIDEWPGIFEEIRTLGIGDVTFRHEKVTLINRRMFREHNERLNNRLRKQKQRQSRDCPTNVTPYSSSSSSSSLKDVELPKGNSTPPDPKIPSAVKQVMELFNQTCKTAPKVIKIDGNRLRKTLSLLKQYPDLEQWRILFETVEKSDFLTGRRLGRSGPFIANFDWIINPTNFLKIIEGNYRNRETNGNAKKPDLGKYDQFD